MAVRQNATCSGRRSFWEFIVSNCGGACGELAEAAPCGMLLECPDHRTRKLVSTVIFWLITCACVHVQPVL